MDIYNSSQLHFVAAEIDKIAKHVEAQAAANRWEVTHVGIDPAGVSARVHTKSHGKFAIPLSEIFPV